MTKKQIQILKVGSRIISKLTSQIGIVRAVGSNPEGSVYMVEWPRKQTVEIHEKYIGNFILAESK